MDLLPVHVGHRRGRQIVRVEDGAQADHGEEERGPHDDGVDQLQLLLALVSEDAVHEHACIRREKGGIVVTRGRYVDRHD